MDNKGNKDFAEDPGFGLLVSAVTDLMVGQQSLTTGQDRIKESLNAVNGRLNVVTESLNVVTENMKTVTKAVAGTVETAGQLTLDSKAQEIRFSKLLTALKAMAENSTDTQMRLETLEADRDLTKETLSSLRADVEELKRKAS